jgi:hypothetical protein
MSAALIAALFFTVALLVTTAYFLMGSLPLLTLRHDTPMDARFVRGFYNAYYLAALITASATAATYALAGRLAVAAGAAALAVLAAVLRRKVIPMMDSLRDQIQVSGRDSIMAFRRIHVAAILLNLAQLVLIVWTLIAVSRQETTGRVALFPRPIEVRLANAEAARARPDGVSAQQRFSRSGAGAEPSGAMAAGCG